MHETTVTLFQSNLEEKYKNDKEIFSMINKIAICSDLPLIPTCENLGFPQIHHRHCKLPIEEPGLCSQCSDNRRSPRIRVE